MALSPFPRGYGTCQEGAPRGPVRLASEPHEAEAPEDSDDALGAVAAVLTPPLPRSEAEEKKTKRAIQILLVVDFLLITLMFALRWR